MGAVQLPLLRLFGTEPIDPKRSKMLGAVRGTNTSPEIDLRRAVWGLGGRFRCHAKNVAGRPDLVNCRARVAVFVDGCFWHGCPQHFKVPKTRTAFWAEKIRRNQEKRAAVLEHLTPEWNVLAFYECDLKADLDGCARKVVAFLKPGAAGPKPAARRAQAPTKARPQFRRTAAPPRGKRAPSSPSP